MNSKTLKSKKKKEISGKSIIFWGVLGAIVLVLIILLIVRIAQSKDINSYDKVEDVYGSEIFAQEEETYFVLFYNFEGSEAMETFDKTMFSYLTYRRDNGDENGAYKLYKAVSTDIINKKCFGDTTNINSTTTFPNLFESTGDAVLQIEEADLPILLVITNGTVSEYQAGESAILTYINNIIK